MSVRKFLIVVDDSAEFVAALRYACRRAKSTGGVVALLRVLPQPEFEHWSGVREEIARQQRQEAETSLQLSAEYVQAETGLPPEFLIVEADSTRAALKQALSEDPDIKILVLAAGAGRGGPGPLVSAIAKDGVRFGDRKVPITIVPGDLTDDEIAALA